MPLDRPTIFDLISYSDGIMITHHKDIITGGHRHSLAFISPIIRFSVLIVDFIE